MEKQVVKNTKFNTLKTKINNLEKQISDATILIHINKYNTDTNTQIQQSLEKKIGDVNEKVPDVTGLVTTTVLHTKIEKVEN